MDPSLTIVVPVRNEAAQLRARVEQLLEVAADVATHFEVLLVDDASTDETDEVACDVSTQYPQVRIVRHPQSQGAGAAARTGLLRSRGNTVFIHDGPSTPRRRDLQELWQRGGHKHLVVGSTTTAPLYLRPDLLSRLQTWGILVANGAAREQGTAQAPSSDGNPSDAPIGNAVSASGSTTGCPAPATA